MLQKLEGNIGVLIGEYIVVAATYILMGANLIPVFEEPRTGKLTVAGAAVRLLLISWEFWFLYTM